MLANTAVQARPGAFAGRSAARPAARPAALTRTVPVDGATFAVRPVAPWARGHLSFRGTRIFTGLMLGWVGFIMFAFGAFAVPAASDTRRAEVDAGLMALLGTVAPWLVALGITQLVAAVAIARDRAWGLRAAQWLLAAGSLVVLGGLVFAVAGRDPFALTDPAANGVALLAWTLGLYALVGWGVRRIVAARQLL